MTQPAPTIACSSSTTGALVTLTSLDHREITTFRRRFGMAFQEGALFDSMSVAVAVGFIALAGVAADSVAAYRRSIALDPNSGTSYWSIANLKTAMLTEADVAQMRARLGRIGAGF